MAFDTVTTIVLIIVGWVAYTYVAYRRLRASMNHNPGYVQLLTPSAFTRILPNIPYVFRSYTRRYYIAHRDFMRSNADIFSSISLFPSPRVFQLELADPTAIKEVFLNRALFPKPVHYYKHVSLFGPNIVASEGDEWKRHRKIASPSFSERNNLLVFNETTKIILGLFEYWESQGQGESIAIANMADVTFEIAMMVIAAAGFGVEIHWKETGNTSPGHKMSFKEALSEVCKGVFLRVAASDRVLDMWEGGRTTKQSFKELKLYMQEMIDDRRQSSKDKDDLFSNLLAASFSENTSKEGNIPFTDDDLMGNTFIFLLAGHETTAHALGFVFGLLAAYQDVQEKLYEEIKLTVRSGSLPTYSDVVKMKYPQAIFNETIRLFPVVLGVPKMTSRDVTLQTTSNDGKNTPVVIPIPAGANIHVNMTATHRNPKYWTNPDEFTPERFFGDYNRDAFIPFSGGARACVGRRFSEIEAITVISLMIQRYRVIVTPDKAFEHETFQQRKARVLKAVNPVITLTPVKVPLTFIRRR